MLTTKIKSLFKSTGKEVNKKKSILKDRLTSTVEANERDRENNETVSPGEYMECLQRYKVYEFNKIFKSGDKLDEFMAVAKHDEVKRRLTKMLNKDTEEV